MKIFLMKVTLVHVSRHMDRHDGANSSFSLVNVPKKGICRVVIPPNVVIQQNSCKLLMMDTLMPETCRAHKK